MVDQLERLKESLEDRYVVEGELGRGGMATVYLAYDSKLRRRVAIKLLDSEVASAVGVERFEREIRVAAGMTHPRILSVHESGQADGLFYYVMPYVDGESLRARLDREKQLPVDDALEIAREVAEALEYAHSRHVIHRDIKPGNILLAPGGAVVADFGVARAIGQAKNDSLTLSGLTVGTPGYMSPEQATGTGKVDGRSDLYSLGCVIYEMLVGEPPFTGRTRQLILARQLAGRPSPVSVVRRGIPAEIDSLLRQLLEPLAADRVQSARWLGVALARLQTSETIPARGSPGTSARSAMKSAPGWLTWSALAAALAGVAWIASRAAAGGAGSGDAAVDTTRYAIFPLQREVSVPATADAGALLHDAMARWRGISLVDPFQVQFALARREAETPSDQARLARELGAGRFVAGSQSMIGSSIRTRAGVYDATEEGRLIVDGTIRFPPDLRQADSLFAALVDELLVPDAAPGSTPGPLTTRSLPARRAFNRGLEAIEAWNLERANAAFTEAANVDPDYAEAHLWAALVRAWSGVEPARWRIPAEQAFLRRDQLTDRDRMIARAVFAQASGHAGEACPVWEEIAETEPHDFAAWQGLAHCLKSDSAVVRDPASPSGWRFRTSYGEALRAYERAFELLPSILASFQRRSYEPLRDLFMIAGPLRIGRVAASDSAWFRAEPAWRGDSLAFVPYPREAGGSLSRLGPPGDYEEALRHLRGRFRDVAVAWLASSPADPDALHAVAIALGLLGDASALDTLRRARHLVRDPDNRLRFAATEVWMSLALALPDRVEALERVRSLADSLLDRIPPGRSRDPVLGAALAALTGRAELAARYLREPLAGEILGAPPPLRRDAPALLVRSALGGPAEELQRLERAVESAIQEMLPPAQRRSARMGWLARPATLAFASHRFESLQTLAGQGDYLLDAQAAWARGDTVGVRAELDRMRDVQSQYQPANLTLDTLYPEVALLVELGAWAEAAAWLDPTLRTLPQVAPSTLGAPQIVAALVRAAALRARIAERLGDMHDARAWASAVVILWSDADPFLAPLVEDMRRIAERVQ